MEGPIQQLKKRVQKLTAKERNRIAIHLGPEALINRGELDITKFESTVRSVNLFNLRNQKLPDVKQLANLWFYGPPGAGKSLRARSIDRNAFIKQCNKWWDGYSG